MTRRARRIRTAVRGLALLLALALFLLLMTGAAFVGDARRCTWLLAHDRATAHTYDCEGTR